MSIQEAYCVQLKKVVSITEARTEFLNLSSCERFQFLCSTESCRQRGVKIIGVNYDHFPDEIKQSPHFKYRESNNERHSPDCQWVQNVTEKFAGETEDEFKLRKTRNRLHDYIDEFQLPIEPIMHVSDATKLSLTSSQTYKNATKPASTTEEKQKRYIKTNQLARLVESYLDAKKTLPEKDFLRLPLKVSNLNIKYLYQYFRRAENAIREKKRCVFIGEAQLLENIEWLYFKLKSPYQENEHSSPIPIYVGIRQSTLASYRYRRMLRSHIDSNPYDKKYFKAYFIPQENEFNIKRVKNQNGNDMDIYFFEIKDLNLFCLFNYSYLKKKKSG